MTFSLGNSASNVNKRHSVYGGKPRINRVSATYFQLINHTFNGRLTECKNSLAIATIPSEHHSVNMLEADGVEFGHIYK